MIFQGVRHAPTAMFEHESRKHNNGRLLGFVTPSECRMGGGQIALLRLIRLRPILLAVINSKPFIDLKMFDQVAYVLKLDTFWDLLFSFCRCFYAPMRLLRLADTKSAIMDKLMFYTLQTENMIVKYSSDMMDKWYALSTLSVRNIMSDSDPDENNKVNRSTDNFEEEEEEFDVDYDMIDDSDDEIEGDRGATYVEKINQVWLHRKKKLIHDYSRAGYLLAPSPVIRAFESQDGNSDPENKLACERLIVKLLLKKGLVDGAKDAEEARMIHLFWKEYGNFKSHTGAYSRKHMWITAAANTTIAYEWHRDYSLSYTKVLGPLACLVCSKIGGIGSAERNWKAVKRVKSHRYTLGNEKSKKQSTIASTYSAQKNEKRRVNDNKAGKLWEEKDFVTLGLDKFGEGIIHASEAERAALENIDDDGTEKRVFRAWKERWESVKNVGPGGDPKLHAMMVYKYGGIKWFDQDNEDLPLMTSHPDKMFFEVRHGNNGYHILSITDKFDLTKEPDNQSDKDGPTWDCWVRSPHFYEAVVEYYHDNPNPNIIVYEQNECLSDNLSDDCSDDDGEE